MTNRHRNVHKQFRMTEKEAADFERAVVRSGLTQAEYIRQSVKGLIPQDAPGRDFMHMTEELRKLRQTLEQYNELTYEYGCIPVGLNDHVEELVRDGVVSITKAVMEPLRKGD